MMRVAVDEADLRARVQRRLDAFVDEQAALLVDESPQLLQLADAARDLLRGGKRLRAAFCYWGFRGAGGPDGDEIVAAAAALELLHASALVHDDVMDDSDTRRGQPAVHRRFAKVHADAGWHGSPERFGQAAAILLGDLALGWSAELFVRSGLPAPALLRGQPVFDLMRTQLMGGQYLDVLEQAHGAGTVESATTVITYKSAKYSVEHPLLVGASLAGAGDDVLAAFSSYGLPLGLAFQLRDDVLGVFGDPGRTGKPAGDDLREGKRTVLVATALAAASPVQAEVLGRLGDPDLTADDLDRMRRVIVDTGALAGVEARIAALVDEAAAALTTVSLAEPAGSVLEALIGAATERLA
jgi:geranylgeranyl diphosphate synthase type I